MIIGKGSANSAPTTSCCPDPPPPGRLDIPWSRLVIESLHPRFRGVPDKNNPPAENTPGGNPQQDGLGVIQAPVGSPQIRRLSVGEDLAGAVGVRQLDPLAGEDAFHRTEPDLVDRDKLIAAAVR